MKTRRFTMLWVLGLAVGAGSAGAWGQERPFLAHDPKKPDLVATPGNVPPRTPSPARVPRVAPPPFHPGLDLLAKGELAKGGKPPNIVVRGVASNVKLTPRTPVVAHEACLRLWDCHDYWLGGINGETQSYAAFSAKSLYTSVFLDWYPRTAGRLTLITFNIHTEGSAKFTLYAGTSYTNLSVPGGNQTLSALVTPGSTELQSVQLEGSAASWNFLSAEVTVLN
jgi:hypothetical protein